MSDNDTTWDTDEVERWIANDEGLYDEARSFARRTYSTASLAIRLRDEIRWCDYPYMQVDYDEVDWEHVAEFVENDL